MARKNVVSIGTNVTPEQKERIIRMATLLGIAEADFVRIAVASHMRFLGEELPITEIKHGGSRKSKG